MKKIIALVITMIMVVALSACGKTSDPADPSTSATEAPSAATATPAQTAAPEPTDVPTEAPTPTEYPLPENPGDFGSSNRSFYWDQSSELHNILVDVYPVDDKKAVIQLMGMQASESDETYLERNCTLTFDLINKAVYRNDESDMTLTIDKEGTVTVTAGSEENSFFEGKYLPDNGMSWLNADTIIEYIRNLPDSGIGDFGKAGKEDRIEESMSGLWFHELMLYRDEAFYGLYVATDDMSAIFRVNDDGEPEIIYGSMESTLDQTGYYEFDIESGEDEENGENDFVYYEQPLIYPYILFGADMTVGQTDSVVVSADWNMTESLKVTSADENIVKVDGTEVTAVGAGETVLNVELVYGGCTRQYTIDVSVAEADPDMVLDPVEYQDPDHISLVDTYTYKYTMDITNDDGLYSVDIITILDPGTYRHWSYYGEKDPSNPNIINLVGACSEITYAEGDYDEEIIVDSITGSVVRNEDGSYLWFDDYANEGELCIFK